MGTAAQATALHYEQRQPETTPLYRLVASHLETFLAEARGAHERGVPRYVERELRAYLACGIHAHGFLRARCSTCRKEILIAFSCKLRGVCPSCNARRMCSTAAHLTDRVFPDVPIRQWVLSVPFELRLLLARNAAALSAVGRIFVREIWRWQCEQFGASLVHGRNAAASRPPNIRGGAVCFPQRFGGSLNLNVHYHVAVPDGLFSREHQGAQGVVFHQLPIPNGSDLEAIGHAVELRVLRWLRRRGLLGADDAEQPQRDVERQRDALDACLRGSLGIGELSSLPSSKSAAGQGTDEDSPGYKRRSFAGALGSRRARSSRGFDIHAGVSVSARDREGRERLLRYCARPPLSLERLRVLEAGRVAYRIKNPRGQQTHRVMSPTQFLARLCALIPPPRHPLVRFHGVFAPHSAWRPQVVALARSNSSANHEAKACRNAAGRDRDPNSAVPPASAGPVESGGPTALGARGPAACNARRMCATAAHLIDRVLPPVPLRQWVLSVPFELRLLLAKRADMLSAIGRIFVQEILRWQREQARAVLPAQASAPSKQLRGGAICFPQRFGGSLNLNVHYHVAVPDGVWLRNAGTSLKFLRLALPNPSDLDAITHSVELRVLRWLKRRGLLYESDESSVLEQPAPSALDACLRGSLGVGELVTLTGLAGPPGPDDVSAPAQPARRSKSARGFDIHAAVAVAAADREGRERLLRYCARAPLSLERLSVLPDGRVAYRIKAPQGRRTHRVMTPVQFLARLSALVPPPRHPLVRFHGVFAPHSAWRENVVALVEPPTQSAPPCSDSDDPEVAKRRPRGGTAASKTPAPAALRTSCGPALPRGANHIDWATLLRRTHDIDALACPCGARLRVIALITEPAVAAAILTTLHLPAVPPPLARARSPDDWEPLAD